MVMVLRCACACAAILKRGSAFASALLPRSGSGEGSAGVRRGAFSRQGQPKVLPLYLTLLGNTSLSFLLVYIVCCTVSCQAQSWQDKMKKKVKHHCCFADCNVLREVPPPILLEADGRCA